MKISVVIPCKNRLSHLLQCLPTVLNQTYQDLDIVVVDFNCPKDTARVITESFTDSRIRVIQEDVPSDYWNLAESRNRGFLHALGSIVLFLDADTILQPTFIEYAIKELNGNTFVTGLTAPPWNGCGCALVNSVDFQKINGYNEALVGWGWEDFDFYGRMEGLGLGHRYFKPELIVNLQHDNEMRNEYHGGRDIHENCQANHEISKTTFRSRI